MALLLFFTFLAGLVTIMAPCIWPLLPIVLAASSAGGKQRAAGVTLGIMTSFTIFTLSISYLEKAFHIDPNMFRALAVIVIVLLGISMLIPPLGVAFEGLVNRLLGPFQGRLKKQGTGFAAGFVMGFSTGMIWAPCSGPILATIATLAATQSVNFKVVLVTLAYVLGLGIPLFLFSLAGSWAFGGIRRFAKYTARIQQAFGLVMIVAAVLIYTNYDKTIQLKVLNAFPSYGGIFTGIENNRHVTGQLDMLKGEKKAQMPAGNLSESLPDLGMAPEFAGISHWLNTPEPLTMAKLRGKTVLVDFWTYTCINCVRELPHVVDWYEKYKHYGFVVVGVHTPEFAFEKETRNVQNALGQFKIGYPVAQDNGYETWRAFDNNYWPALYLIDASGHIRKTHFGEGRYDEMEGAIRQLLREAGNPAGEAASSLKDETPAHLITPETYLGMGRMERMASNEAPRQGTQVYSRVRELPQDRFAYEGAWDLSQGSVTASQGSVLEIRFRADKVFLVVSPNARGDRIKLFLDGKPVDAARAGADVKDGLLVLDTERLYALIDLKGKLEAHLLRLEFESEGDSLYAFTFG